MEENTDELKLKMESGEKEETVYDETGREQLVEDGEISPEEAGFMEGEKMTASKANVLTAEQHYLMQNTLSRQR